MNLNLRSKRKKRLPARVKEPLLRPIYPNVTWSMDFMHDTLENGNSVRSLNIIDDFNREILQISIDTSLPSAKVITKLEELIEWRGKPDKIRVDNGPEFIAQLAHQWSEANGIEFKYIQPGKPMQNAYIERFNKSFRNGVLNACLFENLEDVREQTAQWVFDYNHRRPHASLGNIPPVTYREKNSKNSKASALHFASATPSLHSAQKLLNKSLTVEQ